MRLGRTSRVRSEAKAVKGKGVGVAGRTFGGAARAAAWRQNTHWWKNLIVLTWRC